MGTIRYRIVAGTLPVTVTLLDFSQNVHYNYEEGEFINVPPNNYFMQFHDSNDCFYEEEIIGMDCQQYGVLYNFYAVSDPLLTSSDDGIVPSMAHGNALIAYYGGNTLAGAALKDTSEMFGAAPNVGATNVSKLNLRGGGFRLPNGDFMGINETGIYAHSDGGGDGYTFSNSNTSVMHGGAMGDKGGLSVRLINPNTSLNDGEEGTYVGNNGITYKTICIDGIEWLAENLRERELRSFSSIPVVEMGWDTGESVGCCVYDNNYNNAGCGFAPPD